MASVKLHEKLESTKRHSKQNKAMCLLNEKENKQLRADNKRLKLEIIDLKQRLSLLHQPKDLQTPITTRQALIRAGVFNVHHNDILLFTPVLVQAYQATPGKSAIVKDGLTTCFPKEDLEHIIKLIEELAPVHLVKAWGERMKKLAAALAPRPC